MITHSLASKSRQHKKNERITEIVLMEVHTQWMFKAVNIRKILGGAVGLWIIKEIKVFYSYSEIKWFIFFQ